VNGLARIGAFIADTRGPGLPAAARELATLTLVDFVGAAVAGAREPVSQLAARHVGAAPAGEAATVIGHAVRARPVDAAFINGTTGHALDFDDSNLVLGGHPSVVLYPGLLALGEARGASGRDVLDAYVIGFEVLVAFARAVNFEHYEKGWHPTATLGTFGAAAAAARLLGLDAQQAATAIALAASMASGVKANFGSMAKPLQVGEASRKGLLCALLAADGATASAGALDAKQGFLEVYNGAGHYRAEALAAIGEHNELLRSGIHFKQYACCGSTHAPIDAASLLRKQHGLQARDIAAVRVAMNARRRPHVDRPVVQDELAAKFSVQYTVAAALADGFVGLRHFAPEAIARADLQHLLRRVELADLEGGDAALAQGCELTVQTTDGATFSTRLDTAEGRDADAYRGYMQQKFHDCVHHRFDQAAGDELLQALLAVDRCANVQTLVRRLGAAQAH
jgi:2-methylcitrate dehydratase PrpD